jgi:hypothetical protein
MGLRPQHQCRHHICHEGYGGDEYNNVALDGLRIPETVPSLNGDKEAGSEEHGYISYSGEDLHAFEAERMFQSRLTSSDAQGRIADQHGRKITQIMERVADEGHAPRYDAAAELSGGDDKVHDHRCYEPLAQVQEFVITSSMFFHFGGN